MRILFDPDPPVEGAGGGDADAGAGGDEGGTGAIDTKDAPPAPKFDASAPVPAGFLPSELNMYEGKTWNEVFAGVGELRKGFTDATTKNAELTEQLKKAAASPEGAEAARRAAMVTTEEYKQILANFYDTGEVPQQFVDAVSNQGVVIDADETLEFFQWKKTKRETMMNAGAEASPEGVDFTDLLSWMSSGNSGYSENIRAGFQEMAEGGDYSWVTGVAERYAKAIESNSHRPNLKGNRFMGGEPRHGKPALGGDKVGFGDTADFAAALRAIANDTTLDPGQKQKKRNAAIAARAKQRGDTIPGLIT